MQIYNTTVFLFFVASCIANAQDALDLLFDRQGESGIIGGSPFAGFEESIMTIHKQDFPSDIDQSSLTIRFKSTIDNIYEENRSDELTHALQQSSRAADVYTPLAVMGLPAALRVNMHSHYTRGAFPLISSQSFEYRSETGNLTVGIIFPVSDAMNWSIESGQNIKDKSISPNYEIGFSYQRPEVTTKVKIKNRTHPQFFMVKISGIEGILPFDFLQRGSEISFVVPLKNFLLQLNIHDYFLFPIPHFSRNYETRFSPRGNGYSFAGNVLLTMSTKLTGLFTFHAESLEGKGTFSSRYSSYGSLNTFRTKTASVQLGIKYSARELLEVVSDIKWQETGGNAAGSVENWPFVGIEQLSFSRGYFTGEGSIRLLQFHTGGVFSSGRNIYPGLGINFIHVRTNLHAETWQSRFLSLGERNRQVIEFPFDELDGIVVSGGIKTIIGNCNLVYSLSQVIPLRVIRKEQMQEIKQPGTIIQTSAIAQGSGGQFHQLSTSFGL